MAEKKSTLESLKTKQIIRLSKSCIGEAEKKAIIRVLDHEYLGMGTEVQDFEVALSDFFNRPVACVVNGTAALHLALQASGIGFGDEVLVPTLTYVASFQAISATGAKPIPCDINEKTCLLDIIDAEKRITKNTKAIMPVHYTGGVGNLDELYTFADKYKLRIIEDAAHAFGTTYKNKRVGSIGDISCFSFDGIKNITSGEGGCVVTDDEFVLQKVKDARLLGVEKDTEKRYSGQRSWDFDITQQGWRYHMSNLMAAIGIEQFNRFPELAAKRKTLAKKYDSKFYQSSKIKSLNRDYKTVVPHIYVVRIIGMKNRKKLGQILLDKGIQTGYHYLPNHWLTFYRDNKAEPLTKSELIFPELLSLPLHPDLSINDVEFVANELIKIA